MARSRPALVRMLVALPMLLLVACGGDLTVPNPATLGARANATAMNGGVIATPGGGPTAPTPTTLTLTLGIPTAPASGNMTRTAGVPIPVSGATTRVPGTPVGMSTTMGDTVPYTDSRNRFSFLRPKNWQGTAQSDPDVAVVFVSASPQGVFNVLAKQTPANTTLDQYYNANVSNLKTQVSGYQEGPKKATQSQLGGEPARQIDYFATLSDTRSYFVQLYCIHKGNAYLLTFITYVDPTSNDIDAFNRAAQVVVDSWKFL